MTVHNTRVAGARRVTVTTDDSAVQIHCSVGTGRHTSRDRDHQPRPLVVESMFIGDTALAVTDPFSDSCYCLV